ncbi:uncharacterized protein [Palaemon carinicauda]|uniref:uncharacterized protein n=1 Tax=Palaemon carinicauda TaxID=392227 RepID=UPI0035B5D745
MSDKGEDPVGAVGFEVAEFLGNVDWEEEIGDLRKVELQEIAKFINISVAPGTKKGTLLVQLVTAIKKWKEETTSSVDRTEYISVQDRLELERLQIEKMKLQIATREEERIHEKVMLQAKFNQEQLRIEREREQEQLRLQREREQEKHELQVLHLRQVPAENKFNIGNAIKLMPVFKETEALEFFTVFEKLANRLEWPENMWTTLVQCRLMGKAQKIYAALNEEMSADYSQVKNLILKAYELVPEAYRQKFRNMKKGWEETFVEFARRKRVAFQEWLKAKGVEDFDALKELILIEEFKNNINFDLKTHLEDLKLDLLDTLAVAADEFFLSHKGNYRFSDKAKWGTKRNPSGKGASQSPGKRTKESPDRGEKPGSPNKGGKLVCWHCGQPGHIKEKCRLWLDKAKPVGLLGRDSTATDECFKKYVSEGVVSIKGQNRSERRVKLLRDTGAAQSIILRSVLPEGLSQGQEKFVLLGGFPRTVTACPLVELVLNSKWVKGPMSLAIVDELPIKGVDVIVANDCEMRTPGNFPLVQGKSVKTEKPVFVVTRSGAQGKSREMDCMGLDKLFEKNGSEVSVTGNPMSSVKDENGKWAIDTFAATQKAEFEKERSKQVSQDNSRPHLEWKDGVLKRISRAKRAPADAWEVREQIVVPVNYRRKLLELAHDNLLSGHLGINKTFKKLSDLFFWPSLRRDVKKFVKTCKVCQTTGKPNQKIPKAPLQPIPAIGEPFEESQGQLERFHQTLKSMLSKYVQQEPKNWDQVIPYLLFAFRSIPSDVMGFSPFELTFGHKVRGPLEVVKDHWEGVKPRVNLLDFLRDSREKLINSWDFALKTLEVSQRKMKERYDMKTKLRNFQVGEEVLVLLPIPGNPFKAKFSGPWKILKKVNDLNYVVETPDRRKKTQVCHVNMLKAYQGRETIRPVLSLAKVEEKEEFGETSSMSLLGNSVALGNLPGMLDHLSATQSKEVMNFITKFAVLFQDVPGLTSLLMHDVEVGDARPIKQHPYRVNPSKRDIIQQEVEYMLRHDLIQRSFSPWSSPVVLVKKEGGGQRMCFDYRKVNAVTESDCFPLPRVEDCINDVGAAKYISKFDLLKGYWQVPLTERAKEISAFVTSEGLYSCNVMPFGMKNASATFQRLMNQVIDKLEGVVVYIDDLVVYSNSWESHLKNMECLFERLRAAGLVINLNKCDFAKAKIIYLGHEVGHGKILPKSVNIQSILDFQVPENRRGIRRFLGMVGYYRRFVLNFADVANPLTNLLKKGQRFCWTVECQDAFDKLKSTMINTPILKTPNFKEPFCLAVDASDVGVGAVLSQGCDGEEYPVAYFSKKLSPAQHKYSTVEKETLGLILSLEHFEVYLSGSTGPIVVRTDHNPLVFLNFFKNKNNRLLRWSLRLQEWDLLIQHIAGRENIIPDALSR